MCGRARPKFDGSRQLGGHVRYPVRPFAGGREARTPETAGHGGATIRWRREHVLTPPHMAPQLTRTAAFWSRWLELRPHAALHLAFLSVKPPRAVRNGQKKRRPPRGPTSRGAPSRKSVSWCATCGRLRPLRSGWFLTWGGGFACVWARGRDSRGRLGLRAPARHERDGKRRAGVKQAQLRGSRLRLKTRPPGKEPLLHRRAIARGPRARTRKGQAQLRWPFQAMFRLKSQPVAR